MSGTHKIYVDSRARVNAGTTSHNKFVWQAPRPINVPNCRAFIDSVHLPVAWGTFHDQNQYIYISEQLTYTHNTELQSEYFEHIWADFLSI